MQKTEKQTNHTPLPWHIGIRPGPIIYGPKGEFVADLRNELLPDEEAQGNWKFVLEACNNYSRLKAEKAELLEALRGLLNAYAPNRDESNPKTLQSDVRRAVEALAKASEVAQ